MATLKGGLRCSNTPDLEAKHTTNLPCLQDRYMASDRVLTARPKLRRLRSDELVFEVQWETAIGCSVIIISDTIVKARSCYNYAVSPGIIGAIAKDIQ